VCRRGKMWMVTDVRQRPKVAELKVHGSKDQLNKGVGCLHGLWDQETISSCTRRKQALVRVMCHCGQGSKPCLQCDCPTRFSNPLGSRQSIQCGGGDSLIAPEI